MVVASCNNAAVENVSKELPLIKALGSEYNENCYLKPVAQKIAANHINLEDEGKTLLISLNKSEDRWGLIAAALGKKENRDIFNSRAFFLINNDKMITDGNGSETYRTLASALKNLRQNQDTEKKFSEAQINYIEAKKRVINAFHDIKQIQKFNTLKNECIEIQNQIKRTKLSLEIEKNTLNILKKSHKDLPFSKMLFTEGCKIRGKIKSSKSKINNIELLLEKQSLALRERNLFISETKNFCEHFIKNYPDVLFNSPETNFEDENVQRQCFGHCKLLNKLRSDLTIKAFELHQSWLVATYNHDMIYNLPKLLSGEIKNAAHAKILWQFFFMVVPVISSTFASINCQFKELSQGDIGWLFIDEAGQATPQQAVGALFRTKRAIVVGDPLQVEPVFTIPPQFIEGFARHFLGENGYEMWSPSVMSVQKVADRVNSYGTKQIDHNQWLGSPLRVHRRCYEPMFTISNKIAYNSKMIHGLEAPWAQANSTDIWGHSQWIDISGKVDGKHFVPEQAEYVLGMIYQYIDQMEKLPKVYIITPFRNVKTGVRSYLNKNFCHPSITKKFFNNWLDKRIGTIHTFQGKEEENVILILGVSSEKPGPAKWASEKPNLLNVACTRAKKRFFIIGCKQVWAGLEHFSIANNYLLPTYENKP